MAEIVQLLVSAALQIWLSFWLIRRDERRLTSDARDRSFPDATFWIAVVVFGPLSIPVHYCRTRRSWAGLMLGLLWFLAASALVVLAQLGLVTILE